MTTERVLVLNKSADKLKGCAALPRAPFHPLATLAGAETSSLPLNAKKQKNAREGAETPADPLRRFPRFLSLAALHALFFALSFRWINPFLYAFFRPLSRKFTCGTVVFQISLFRPFVFRCFAKYRQ